MSMSSVAQGSRLPIVTSATSRRVTKASFCFFGFGALHLSPEFGEVELGNLTLPCG